MARTKQTARKCTGGFAPKEQLAAKPPRKNRFQGGKVIDQPCSIPDFNYITHPNIKSHTAGESVLNWKQLPPFLSCRLPDSEDLPMPGGGRFGGGCDMEIAKEDYKPLKTRLKSVIHRMEQHQIHFSDPVCYKYNADKLCFDHFRHIPCVYPLQEGETTMHGGDNMVDGIEWTQVFRGVSTEMNSNDAQRWIDAVKTETFDHTELIVEILSYLEFEGHMKICAWQLMEKHGPKHSISYWPYIEYIVCDFGDMAMIVGSHGSHPFIRSTHCDFISSHGEGPDIFNPFQSHETWPLYDVGLVLKLCLKRLSEIRQRSCRSPVASSDSDHNEEIGNNHNKKTDCNENSNSKKRKIGVISKNDNSIQEEQSEPPTKKQKL